MDSESSSKNNAFTLQIDSRKPTLILAVVGGSALALGLLAALLAERGFSHFLRAYLVNFTFFLSISLGALFFVMLHHLTRAGWSVVLRRLAEILAAAVPWMSLLFLPILLLLLLGDSRLYAWNSPELINSDPLIRHKAPYLSKAFFTLRSLVYLGVWSWLALYYWRRSLRSDETGDASLTRRMRLWSGPAMVAFAGTTTFAAFDWLMSLEPHFFSTICGVYFFTGCVVAFLALLALLAAALQRAGRLKDVITVEHYHDLGKLLFGFVFFWGYIAYSQYMLIWYANIPEETGWYLVRQNKSWAAISLLLLFGHFLVPFLGLMPRSVKRNRAALAGWGAVLLAMHWIDVYWLAMPQMAPNRVPFGLIDICCFVAIGAFYAAVCLLVANGRSLIPLRDPQLSESLAFENI